MYGALYTRPTPTLEASVSCRVSGVQRTAIAICGWSSGIASMRSGPIGLINQAKRLAVVTALRDNTSTGEVKPRAPKKHPDALVCTISLTGC